MDVDAFYSDKFIFSEKTGIVLLSFYLKSVASMSEKFCLKWNDFHANVSKSFKTLRSADDFYDVTLVSDDQKQLSAHKIVLSTSSEYFKDVLRSNKHPHPMLCLNGVSSNELSSILDYIYNGEIQIYQEQLDSFLQIAQRFQLEGLIQGEEAASSRSEPNEAAYSTGCLYKLSTINLV